MKKHILLEKAQRLASGKLIPLTGWTYRRDIGAWVDEDHPDNLLVDQPPAMNAQPQPGKPAPKPRPMTKKADFETGEDQK